MNRMTVLGLDHLLLAIPPGGEDAARGFYCGLLGFSEIEKPASLAGRGGAWFVGGTLTLHVGIDVDFSPPPGRIRVSGRRSGIADGRLRAANVELVFDVPLPGYERVHVRDPFGNRIELMEKLLPR